MTDIAMKAKVGFAAIAVAASATLIPMTTAEATPAFGPGTMPQTPLFGWWHQGSDPDLLGRFIHPDTHFIQFLAGFFHSWGCYGHHHL
jgi:hypothetical protein